MSVAFMRAWEESKEGGGAPQEGLPNNLTEKSKIVDNNYKKWEKVAQKSNIKQCKCEKGMKHTLYWLKQNICFSILYSFLEI